ncbi:Sterile alpha motif domain-containing protein 15 [Eumeta japonica]|uniref:Sterile alpha motif domain-containing protein 15 n=1 Tax=Eumeta variegata TaxID=151549 RepID=A0A4C1VVI7_EUMVA|nr:Sterile alpha motif domain-containing protein 15 [Eumeta japonica]
MEKNDQDIKKWRKKKTVMPRREPSSNEVPESITIYVTADKLTCASCGCYPNEEPYTPIPPKQIRQCQRTPRTLYELAAERVELLEYPEALQWTVEEVEAWMRDVVGFPQYVECIRNNHINGLRLLTLEDASLLPPMSVHHFEHIKKITSHVRELYSVEFVRFSRSIGLPPRKPMTHVVQFKSKTAPPWSATAKLSKCDILRKMKILDNEPYTVEHFDLVWYIKPKVPKTLFGPSEKIKTIAIPRYREPGKYARERLLISAWQIIQMILQLTGLTGNELGFLKSNQMTVPYLYTLSYCQQRPRPLIRECLSSGVIELDRANYETPRKFIFDPNVRDSQQFIWIKRSRERREKKVKKEKPVPYNSVPWGLKGNDFLLARRKMPKQKFFNPIPAKKESIE